MKRKLHVSEARVSGARPLDARAMEAVSPIALTGAAGWTERPRRRIRRSIIAVRPPEFGKPEDVAQTEMR